MRKSLDPWREAWQKRAMRQTTIAKPVTVRGAGLHTGHRATVTLRPAPADTGYVVGHPGGIIVPMTWTHRVPSRMSTSIGLGDGRAIRTIEHLMAALVAEGIDNVRVEIEGDEIPILDGSAAPWCRRLREAGTATLDAPRRAIRPRRPVQITRDGGFLRFEPGEGFSIDVTHDVLPALPVMRWQGLVGSQTFFHALARSRSFGNLHRRLGMPEKPVARPPGATPNAPDPVHEVPDVTGGADPVDPTAPLLRGWRPGRAALIFGRHILPWPRFADEPGRHVALDMIGDLALAGHALAGRVVAHNPSHEKTYALVAALMSDAGNWELVEVV